MLSWAIICFIIAAVAYASGAQNTAGQAASLGKICFVLAVIFTALHLLL